MEHLQHKYSFKNNRKSRNLFNCRSKLVKHPYLTEFIAAGALRAAATAFDVVTQQLYSCVKTIHK